MLRGMAYLDVDVCEINSGLPTMFMNLHGMCVLAYSCDRTTIHCDRTISLKLDYS